MFKRRNYGDPLPGKKQIKAHLDFLNSVKDENPVKQCETCIHAKAWNGKEWCMIHRLPPTGLCLEKEL